MDASEAVDAAAFASMSSEIGVAYVGAHTHTNTASARTVYLRKKASIFAKVISFVVFLNYCYYGRLTDYCLGQAGIVALCYLTLYAMSIL